MKSRPWIHMLVVLALAPARPAKSQPRLQSLFEFPVDLSEKPALARAAVVDVRVQLRETSGDRRILHEEDFPNRKVPQDGRLTVRLGLHRPIARGDWVDRTVSCAIAARASGQGDYVPVGKPYAARLVFEKPKTLWEKIRFDRWVILGVAGQLLFTMRFLIQWIATERRRESTIPIAFWWCSLGGGLTVLVYGLIEREPIIILGQSCAFLVYMRNLYFIYKKREGAAAAPSPEDIA